jgi:hypothetical protein
MRTYIYIYIYVCTYIYIYTSICVYTYTEKERDTYQWAPNGPNKDPNRAQNVPKWIQNGLKHEPSMGPISARMGHKLSVEQTLLADSLLTNLNAKKE